LLLLLPAQGDHRTGGKQEPSLLAYGWEEVIAKAAEKRAERGGFAERIILLEVKL